MTATALRQKYMRQFAGMEKHSRLAAGFILSSYLAQIGLAIAAGAWLLSHPASALTVAGMFLVALFIGTRLRGLNNIVHECSHATFTAVRGDNVLIGRICASLTLGCFGDYRDEHLSHHAHLGDYEQDLDLQGIEGLRLHEPLTRANLIRHLTNPLIGRHLPYYFRVSLSKRDGWQYLALKIGLIAAALAFTAVFPLTGLLFVIAPFALFYTTLNYWADCLDHAGLCAAGDDLDSSRNIVAPWLLRVLFFPRNDCFHLVHHLFPHIPARHLGTTHDVLAHDEIYVTKQNAVPPYLAAPRPELGAAATRRA